MRLTYKSLDDVAQALGDLACLIRDMEEVSSDRRTAHLTRHAILIEAALHRKAIRENGSLSKQLMEFIVSPTQGDDKPKLSIVRTR